MDEEVAMIEAQLTNVQVETRTAMNFYKGELEGKEVVVVRSGIGKVNAAMCTQILADIYGVTDAVDTGIVGSLKAGIDIGDIVLPNNAVQRDMDVTRFGYEPGQIPRMEALAFKADEDLIYLAGECCSRVNPDVRIFIGWMVTGDQFISDENRKKWLTDTFKGYCTEMGGAAIVQACYLNSIPFLIARVVFDKVDDSVTVDYPAFEAKAIIHDASLLTEIVRSIWFR